MKTTRRATRRWKLSEQNFENFIVTGRFFPKSKNFFKIFIVLQLQAAITLQWLQIAGYSLPKLPATACLVSIFTFGINSVFLWPVRSIQETSPNSLRRLAPVHEWHDTPWHNVDGLSGRGLMTSEYSQNGDMPKRRQTVIDVTARASSQILYCEHSTAGQ